MTKQIQGSGLIFGQGKGQILRLSEPISFWGGVDPQTGTITDIHHPQHGQNVTGRILALTSSRGSSTGSYILMELIRAKLAPAAIVLAEPDGVICTGVLVGLETYGAGLPVIQVPLNALETLKSGVLGEVDSSDELAILRLFK